jgi:hypothetical protein
VAELRLEVAATLTVAIAEQQLRRQQALAALHAPGRADRPDAIETLLARGYTANG